MRALLVAGLLVLAVPATAGAQDLNPLVGFGPNARVVSAMTAKVHTTGALAVEWESDPETCAAVGRCGLAGEMTWRPRGAGSIFLGTLREGSTVARRGFLALSGRGGDETDGARTRVRRTTSSGSQLCADTSSSGPTLQLEEKDGLVAVGLAQPNGEELFATRCAGPVAADLAPALPSLRVPYGRLAGGNTELGLGGEGTFAAGGLRGRVSSTLNIHVGRPQEPEEDEERVRRYREVDVRFRVAEVRGDATAEITGAAEAVECAPLDACGLAGSLRHVPASTTGEAQFTALARASVRGRALRSSLGLVPGGTRPGVDVFGFAAWEGPGRAEVSVGRDGEAPCTDAAEDGQGFVTLQSVGSRVRAEYFGQEPQLRCPGPLGRAPALPLRAAVPLSAFGARRVELRFTGASAITDDGWRGTSRGDITVVLERTTVRERVFRIGG